MLAPYPSIVSTVEEQASEAGSQTSVSADIQAINGWLESEAELAKIRKFGDDWDGFGASAPDPLIVDIAMLFLHMLRRRGESRPPKRVILSPDGFVALEWLDGDGFLRAEIVNRGEVEWMRAVPGGGPAQFVTEKLPGLTAEQKKRESTCSATEATEDESVYAYGR